jgi:hypothetical protein
MDGHFTENQWVADRNYTMTRNTGDGISPREVTESAISGKKH